MKKLNDGLISEKLKDVYFKAKDANAELELIVNDPILQRRMTALRESPL